MFPRCTIYPHVARVVRVMLLKDGRFTSALPVKAETQEITMLLLRSALAHAQARRHSCPRSHRFILKSVEETQESRFMEHLGGGN